MEDEAFESFVMNSEENRELFNKYEGIKRWEDMPAIDFTLEFDMVFAQNIMISTDGNKLLLPDFLGSEGEVLELARIQ